MTYRPHIAVVGRRNVGKSRFVNSIIGKEVSLVGDSAGTTVNITKNQFELLPYGPVLIVDTAGIEDKDELGSGRITKTIKTIAAADLVILIVDSRNRLSSKERELIAYLDKIDVTYIIVVNKIEFGVDEELLIELKELRVMHFEVSCKENVGFEELKRKLIRMLPRHTGKLSLNDLIKPSDFIMIVLPTEINDPERDLIQVQTEQISSSLDKNTRIITCNDSEFPSRLSELDRLPDLVITDSQLVEKLIRYIPESTNITTFPLIINLLNKKLPEFVKGLKTFLRLDQVKKILITEGCSEHPQNDSKTRIRNWLLCHSVKEENIIFTRNTDLPDDLSEFSVIIHCDGCRLSAYDYHLRLNEARLLDVPIVSLGTMAAFIDSNFKRTLIPLGIKQ